MCGITGVAFVDPARHADRAQITAMNDAMRHRGPDSDGFLHVAGCSLAMRRLAIIDRAGGRQPISNESGTVNVVFNGEIYNFAELRTVLESKGHVFATASDTEVIVHAWEEYGADCVKHLRGMFAFALWDAPARTLFLARDRVGKKPLYYTLHDNALWFASEMSCLFTIPGLRREIDPVAIHHYLSLQYVPDPMTGLAGVKKMPPAHTMTWRGGEQTITRYWELHFESKHDLSYSDAITRTRELITEAVRIRLVSEVPLGAHLSGGVDSAIVTTLMARATSTPVNTFSIGFEEKAYDEREHARRVAAACGARHEEFVVDPQPEAWIDEMVQHFGEPFADPAAIPTWHLARMTRKQVTVALNGDGGDEAFAGYQRHAMDPLADLLGRFPRMVSQGLPRLLARMIPRRANIPPERDVASALMRLSAASGAHRSSSVMRWGSYFSEEEKRALYTPEFARRVASENSTAWLRHCWDEALARHPLDRTLATDLVSYLPGALLPKVDRMTMAHSLEARSPFLDHHVLEFAARLPVSFKVRGFTTKRILRDAFSDMLPPGIGRRGKMGFGVPLAAWFRGPLSSAMNDLAAENSILSPYLRTDLLRDMAHHHQSGHADHGKRWWALLMLAAWLRLIKK